MFMRIVQQVNGQVMGLYTRASSLVKERLLPSVNSWLASIIQAFQNVANQLSQVAQTVSNIKVWLASRTIAGQLTNQEPISAKHLATQLGLQPQTIVPPISQPVVTAQSRKRGRPAGSTKSAQSRSKGNKTAQTHTATQSTADGLKSAVVAKQLRQHATKQSKKGK